MTHTEAAIQLGIIGCGRVAVQCHIPALLRRPEYRVTAVADPDEAAARRVAELLGGCAVYTEYRALLERPDVEAVGILASTPAHGEAGVAALAAGKHVMMEKPLAMTLSECDRMAEAARASKAKVVVGHNLRWHRLVRQAKEIVASGQLGRIKAVRSTYTHARAGLIAQEWHQARATGGGVLLNEAVHHLDLWHLFTARRVEQIQAYTVHSEQGEDETSVVAAHLSGNVLATGVFTLQSGPTNELELCGEYGRLCLSLYRFDGLEWFPSTSYPGNAGGRLTKLAQNARALPGALRALREGGEFPATYGGLWSHMADCILRGAASECTLEDGRASLGVALAAIASTRMGVPVRPDGLHA